MKHLKVFLALLGSVLWGAFAIFMNDMNSASDLDLATGLVKLAVVGVLATTWLVFWVGLTWFRLHEARWGDHLTIVASVLWIYTLVLDIGLPWLSYVVGWMWPSFLSVALLAFLVLGGAYWHAKVLFGHLRSGFFGLILTASVLLGSSFAFFVSTSSSQDIHDLPYNPQVFIWN